MNSSLLGEKPDPWPLVLVMVRSDGFRKLLSRMSKMENKGLKCVCVFMSLVDGAEVHSR